VVIERSIPLRDQDLLAAVLADPAHLLRLAPFELDLVLRLLRRARLLGRIAGQLAEIGDIDGKFPRAAADQLVSAATEAKARAGAAHWELDRLTWALDDLPAEVPLIALKGCAYLLAETPNARGRTFADVDLMVPEQHLAGVEQMLRTRGWRQASLDDYDERYYREWAHEVPPLTHVERGVEVDLHHNILMRTARLRPDARLLVEAARPVAGTRFKVLAPIDMVLHAMVHLFEGGEIDNALRELVDIDQLLRHFAATETGFWDRFWMRACALDLARPAFYALRYARRLLGTPVPDSAFAAAGEAAPSRVVLDLMDCLVPLSVFPLHPDRPDRAAARARRLLYLRSHWVRMPPAMLIRHLAYKSLLRFRDTRPAA
jgi:hypothetical protein